MSEKKQEQDKLSAVKSSWDHPDEDHFGYESDEERRAKRGLEDWELVNTIPESQRGIPRWFIAVIVVVLLVAIGLSFPFWGDRPGYERSWFNWGFAGAILYIIAMSVFVYFMVNLYGSKTGGRLDADKKSGQKKDSDQDRNG